MTDQKDPRAHPAWALDPATAARTCAEFISETLAEAGRQRLVVGLSGGIDSAVAAGLAVRAVGAENLLGVMMPYATSSPESVVYAQEVAETLGLQTELAPITSMVDAFLAEIPAGEHIRRGNVMARCRMILLYDRSAREKALVLGTGNRTEALLGYTTIYGDNACALNPLGRLYKTEVRLLARWLQLPEAILNTPPSADLWPGQADEDELGFSYAEVDDLLHHMIDRGRDPQQLQALGFAPDLIARVRGRVRAMTFKRRLPPSARFPGRPDPDPTADGPGARAGNGGFH